MPSVDTLLYETVARLIERQIATGALRCNDRVPSIRTMSQAARVSTSTVVQAYQHLESKGIIAARPQSGFYVQAPPAAGNQQPRSRISRSKRPRPVVGEVLETCLEALARTDLVPLNCAKASSDLYPNRRLSRLTREVLRDSPQHAGEILLPPGDPDLRRELAKRMTLAGAPTDPDEIVITSGAMDAITLALRVLCNPGDTVLVESPTYFGVLQPIEFSGLKVVEVANRPGEGIDADAIRQIVRTTKIAAAVLMPSCNNPTGSCTPDDAKRAIVATLSGAGVPIIEDDVHGDLYRGLQRPRSLRAFDESGLVISCGSVSKTIAAGYRIGWAVSAQYHRDIAQTKFFSSLACPTLQQKVLARYFAGGSYDRFLRGLRQTVQTNTERMMDGVARHFPKDTKIARPAGGTVLWIELPDGTDSTKLFHAALAQGIGVLPGTIFSACGSYRNYLRLNCGLPWSRPLENAIAALGKLARG